LKNISVTIPAYSVIAVVAGRAREKTTLASLLTRFYDPVSGAIFSWMT